MDNPIQNFKPSRFTIKVKLILMISIIIVLSLSTMIYLASLFFRIDSEKRVQENNLKITEVIGQRVETELISLIVNLRSNALALSKGVEGTSQLLKLFFSNYRNVFFFGIATRKGNTVSMLSEFFNQSWLQEHQLSDLEVRQLISLHNSKLLPAFQGTVVMINASQGFSVPAFALSAPLEAGTILVAYSDLSNLLKAFAYSGITTTYMVTTSGEILAHPDERLVLANANVSTSSIVQTMLQSKVDNGQTRFLENGIAQLGSYKKLPLAGLGIISTVAEDKALEEVYNITRRNLLILIIVLGLAIITVFFYSRSLSNPIVRLVAATREIERGNFRVNLKPTSRDEIGILTNSFIQMGLGLEEREKVKQILGAMIDPVVVAEAMKDLAALKRGAERIVTAFFSDVANFSTISEKLRSEQLAALLNEYLSAMTIILKKHEGVLDKYIGDAIVAIWNAPLDVENHTLKAARASVEMLEKLAELRNYWTKNNLYIKEAQQMDIRIGLNHGLAKTGFMGTDALASYTMMGDTVNLAARLEAAAKDYGVSILISEMVQNAIQSEMFTRKLDLVRVKGKDKPVTLFELVHYHSSVTPNIKEATKIYEAGFELYLKRDFARAKSLFAQAEAARGAKDKAARLLIERCEEYLQNPPPPSWDGVFTRTHK